jgi:glyoxylase-like metal-dependent hydrolase (beta-lactamase superfamily II)
MFIETVTVTDFQTNCYIVAAPCAPAGLAGRDGPTAGRDRPCHIPADARPGATMPGAAGPSNGCLLIDPGGEADLIIARLRHLGLQPELIVNTHGHADHLGANAELKRRFPDVTIAVGSTDAHLLASPVRNLAVFFARWTKSPKPDRLLADGDLVEAARVGLAGTRVALRVRELPGHTRGHIVLVAEGETPPVVFCGDTLFAGSIGRTDLPGGSHELLLAGIARVLLTLPPRTVLYPGHGPATTVAAERARNPFLRDLRGDTVRSVKRSDPS